MKEHGTLFRADMVRAILAGTKSQTRRLPSRANCLIDGRRPTAAQWARLDWASPQIRVDVGPSPAGNAGPYLHVPEIGGETVHRVYPIWRVGDLMWVRETHIAHEVGHIQYAADYARDPKGEREHGVRWTPSIHMPRWASRITLEITDVRAQRLQEISDEDALAEGLRSDGSLGAQCSVELPGHRTHHDSPKECFRLLWESIHGPGSWDVNPFVWVIVFRRIGL